MHRRRSTRGVPASSRATCAMSVARAMSLRVWRRARLAAVRALGAGSRLWQMTCRGPQSFAPPLRGIELRQRRLPSGTSSGKSPSPSSRYRRGASPGGSWRRVSRASALALLAPPNRSWLQAFWAILLAEGSVVPLSPLHPLREQEFFLSESRARALLVTEPLVGASPAHRQILFSPGEHVRAGRRPTRIERHWRRRERE